MIIYGLSLMLNLSASSFHLPPPLLDFVSKEFFLAFSLQGQVGAFLLQQVKRFLLGIEWCCLKKGKITWALYFVFKDLEGVAIGKIRNMPDGRGGIEKS